MTPSACIATWLVLDDETVATAFPSAGKSSTADVQMIYWRCVAVFFMTSRIHNPDRRHVLYSNIDVRRSGPPEIVEFLDRLNVEFIQLDITYRLPAGSVSAWGNQFYVLNVIEDFVRTQTEDVLILADSDCIWRRSADPFLPDVLRHGSLLYTLAPSDQKNYEVGQRLNGLSHARMKGIVQEVFGVEVDGLPQYHGGEFLASSRAYCETIVKQFPLLWDKAVQEAILLDAIKEEAHFLSILAEANRVPRYTANDIVRRMWTNFEDQNILEVDMDLTLWHLPAEKKFGFRRIWDQVKGAARPDLISPSTLNAMTAVYMGVPKRGTVKLVQDLWGKLGPHLKRARA